MSRKITVRIADSQMDHLREMEKESLSAAIRECILLHSTMLTKNVIELTMTLLWENLSSTAQRQLESKPLIKNMILYLGN